MPMMRRAFCSRIAMTTLAAASSYSCAAAPSGPVELHAGPVRMKLADGELRYLRVGEEEVIRRVYFAVRDEQWNTVVPRFTRVDLEEHPDQFTLRLAAHCQEGAVDFDWTATVTGTPAGVVSFAAEGTPNAAFRSNRIGLCVLYGSDACAGQTFETLVTEETAPRSGTFSRDVNPELLASDYRIHRFTTRLGSIVSCKASGLVRMEDQRNYGDSSYKAYQSLDYPYPDVAKGAARTQSFTITAEPGRGPLEIKPRTGPTHVSVGEPIAGRKLPQLIEADPAHKSPGYYAINFNRAKFENASVLLWNYTPFVHLPDDDVMLENISTVLDQAQTARAFSPHASLHVGPIALSPPSPHPNRYPSRPPGMAAAWAAAFYGNLARAGISKANFDMPDEGVGQFLKSLDSYQGRPLLNVSLNPGHPLTERGVSPLQAFAAQGADGDALWLINLSGQQCEVAMDNVSPTRHVRVLRIVAEHAGDGAPAEQTVDRLDAGALTISPWEIRRLVFEK